MESDKRRLRALMEAPENAVVIIDPSAVLLHVNETALKRFAATQEVVGQSAWSMLSPEVRQTWSSTVCRALESKKPVRVEDEGVRGDWYDTTMIPILDDHGDIVELLVIARDVTEQKFAEIGMRQMEKRLRDIMNLVPQPIFVEDEDARYVVVNRAAAAFFGLEPEDMIGATNAELAGNHDVELAERQRRENLTIIEGGKPVLVPEDRVRRLDGEERILQVTKAPTEWFGDGRKAVLSVAVDVSELRETEKQLRAERRKLRSLAVRLTSIEEAERRRVSEALHANVGQLLKEALTRLATLRANVKSTEVVAVVDEVVERCKRAVDYTRSLVVELSPPILYDLGLEPALEWLIEQHAGLECLSIELHDDGRPKPTDDDVRALLFNAVRELLVNAAKHTRASLARVSVSRDGDFICVVVEDDGKAFDIDSLSGAHGFGLFSIRQRLDFVGGSFTLQTRSGSGTRVTLRAPLAAGRT
jgi:PAS domain S-box-containing protein